MTDTITLAEQIRAALDAEEISARAATRGPWRYNPAKQWHSPDDLPHRVNGEEYVGAGPLDDPICVAATGPAGWKQCMDDAAYIAAHDPTATLRRIAAHRKILDEYDALAAQCHGEPEDAPILWWIDNTLLPTLAEAYGITPEGTP